MSFRYVTREFNTYTVLDHNDIIAHGMVAISGKLRSTNRKRFERLGKQTVGEYVAAMHRYFDLLPRSETQQPLPPKHCDQYHTLRYNLASK